MIRISAVALYLIVATLFPLRAQTDQGGPDGFGYYYESSQDPGDTIRFSWLDPARHTPITCWTPDPDDGWAIIHLPGRFPFYGDTLDSIIVCTNGFLQYPTTSTSHLNMPLPVSSIPFLVAAFWDDLSPAAAGQVLHYDDPAGTFTAITWQDVVRFGTSETVTCQVLMFADGRLRLNYLKVPPNSRFSTIGIQGNSGAGGHYLEYVCDGWPSAHVPQESSSVVFFVRRLENDVGIQRLSSPVGWVPPGQQVPVATTVRNYGLSSAAFSVRALILRGRFPHDTLFERGLTVTGLAPGDTAPCYFGDFLTSPNPDSWRVITFTLLPGDQYPRNDTACGVAFSVPPAFGSVLESWDFPTLGSGFNLAGISFRADSGRFYVAVNDPGRIYSFPSAEPTALRQEPFELQSFFGDDIIWGVAWDDLQPGFWLAHVSNHDSGCILARYSPDGTFTGDTWEFAEVTPDAWLAGIDCGPDNTLYATSVGAGNHIYHLDPTNRTVLGRLTGPSVSWRACSYVGDHEFHLLTGGWNDHQVVQLNRAGSVIRYASTPDLADLDVYQPSSPPVDSFIWAYSTRNNELNTIAKVSLGLLWSGIGISEPEEVPAPTPALFVTPNPVTGSRATVRHSLADLPGRFELRDVTGSLVAAGPLVSREVVLPLTQTNGTRLASGIYLLRLSTRKATVTHKLVVAIGD